jgi:hypothetical protein
LAFHRLASSVPERCGDTLRVFARRLSPTHHSFDFLTLALARLAH